MVPHREDCLLLPKLSLLLLTLVKLALCLTQFVGLPEQLSSLQVQFLRYCTMCFPEHTQILTFKEQDTYSKLQWPCI